MSLHYSCNHKTGAVVVWEKDPPRAWQGSIPYADLTECSDSLDEKVSRANEIVNAVNRLRRIERAGASARDEMARSER